jgi:hypothetical protein
VGKSRICAEFMRSAQAEGCLILETGCVSYRKTTSYLPIIELLRSYFQIEERDDAHKIREKVRGKVMSLDIALEPYWRRSTGCSTFRQTIQPGRRSIRNDGGSGPWTASSGSCCGRPASSRS